MKILIFEWTLAVDAAGTLQTFYFTDHATGYAPADAPADYEPRLRNPGLITSGLASDLRLGGAGEITRGEVELDNIDGALDDLALYGCGFSGRILLGEHDGLYADCIEIANGIISGAAHGLVIRCRWRDRQQELDTAFQPAVFAGTNSGASGIEGTAADIGGRVKPVLLGSAPSGNITPVMLNSNVLIMGFNFNRDGSTRPCLAISGVRDGGVPLTFGVNHANLAALQAASVSSGYYDTCTSESLIKLGAKPVYGITLDATSLRDKLHQVVYDLLIWAGVPTANISAEDFAAFATTGNYTVGEYVDYTTTTQQLLTLFLESGFAWLLPDAQDVYRVARISPPEGDVVATFCQFHPADGSDDGEYDILGLEYVSPNNDTDGAPLYSVQVAYGKNFTQQGVGQLASAVDAEDVEIYARDYLRTTPAEDESLLLQFPLSGTKEYETQLTELGDAEFHRDLRFALFGVPRVTYVVKVPFTGVDAALIRDVRPGGQVLLRYPRYGLSDGKVAVVTQRVIDLLASEITFSLFG